MKKNSKKILKIGRKIVTILGINVDSTSVSSVLTGVEDKISHKIHPARNGRDKFYIVTPNPEQILSANENQSLKNAINSADFAVPDGVGLNYASKFLFGKSLSIIPGRKLFLELINLAAKNKWKVFLLGGRSDESAIAAQKLVSSYPNILISSDKGPKLNQKAEPETKVDIKLQKDVVDKINKFRPNLLFVAFGAPKQEIWIQKNLPRLNIGGAMAVGGTFRYVAGLSKLPPKWMEKAGLEWVWRLIAEPYRFGRIFNAFPIFPLKIFLYKFSSK